MSSGTGVVEYVKTRSFCRYCVTLPALAGMQDFLRLIDAPVGSVTIGRCRSTIYSPGGIFPSKNTTLEQYCWPNSLLHGNGMENQSSYVILTLLPSMAGGLVPGNIEKLGIYVTVTEEIIRGHTGPRKSYGRYYEWVAPVMAGVKSRRVQTFFLAVGCSLILPSTFAFRLGAHCSEEIVVFVHSVRVILQSGVQKPFIVRPKSFIRRDLHEYGNFTEVVRERFMKGQDKLSFEDFCERSGTNDYGTMGTIPSLASLPMNTKVREKIADPFYNIRLGSTGVREAYRRTPVMKIQIPSAMEPGPVEEEDAVEWMAKTGKDRLMIEDVPYGSFEFLKGNQLLFPISAGRRKCDFHSKARDKVHGDDVDSISGSKSSSDTESSDGNHSERYGNNSGESSSEYSSDSE